ncbi:MAG: hypothetical protein ACXVEU_10655 [Nocardioidaceae bacterium]
MTRDAIERFRGALNSHDIDEMGRALHEECVFKTTDPPDVGTWAVPPRAGASRSRTPSIGNAYPG